MIEIISCGLNIPANIERCAQSVDRQQNRSGINHCMVIDNGRGKIYNFIKAVLYRKMADDDIIIDLDLDDYLEYNAIETVMRVYDKNPDLLLTYGSYKTVSGKPARFCGEYKTASFRTQKWKGSHLKSFKYKLFKKINTKDLKGKDGRYLMVCADIAMMFPMMEMAGLDRMQFIDKPIYNYDDTQPWCDHKVKPDEQKRIEKYLRGKKPYLKLE